MAKRSKKTVDVQKFGGVDDLGSIKEVGNLTPFKSYLSDSEKLDPSVNWDAKSIETQSTTNLEQDQGHGQVIVLRHFEFKLDASELTRHYLERGCYPSKQDLFNSVLRFIETTLWGDGLKVWSDQDPRVLINDTYTKFDVFVTAIPQKGQRVLEKPKTLTEIVHGR